MYYLKKTLEIAVAHSLCLPYKSKCNNLHGHSLKITVYCKSQNLNDNGMVVDFVQIKDVVNSLDHGLLNDKIEQPTSENIAEYLCGIIPLCYKVTVQESEGSEATYEI